MAKIELTLTSTSVDGDYGIVDIYYNGNKVESDLQLSNVAITISHDLVPVDGSCTVRVDLLNDKATDYEQDGIWDEVMDVRITSSRYADDNVTYVTMIPHAEFTETDAAGNPVTYPPVEYLSVWGKEYSKTFPTSRYIP